MRLTILLFLLLLLPASNNVFAIGSITTTPTFQTKTTFIKKQSLKEKLLVKWYKQQLRKKTNLDKAKKTVNTLGYISLAAGILAPLLALLTAGIASYGFAVFIAIFAMALAPTAIIFGIISLRKRKKLEDKTGTSAAPAIIGLIAGSAFLILLVAVALSFSFNYGS